MIKIFNLFVQHVVVIFTIVSVCFYSANYEHQARIVFFDVGQGDAILFQPAAGVDILVDGGPGSDILHKLSKYIAPWDNKIEVVVITHPHADHILGLLSVLESYEIGEIWINPACYKSELYEEFFKFEDKFRFVNDSDSFIIGNARVDILFPFETQIDSNNHCAANSTGVFDGDENVNNESIVFEIIFDEYKILMMGDAEVEQEKLLLQRSLVRDVDILKAGHHCSKTSSSEKFLLAAKPEIAICSTGFENKYGHPHNETVENFEKLRIKYLVTYKEGDIVVKL